MYPTSRPSHPSHPLIDSSDSLSINRPSIEQMAFIDTCNCIRSARIRSAHIHPSPSTSLLSASQSDRKTDREVDLYMYNSFTMPVVTSVFCDDVVNKLLTCIAMNTSSSLNWLELGGRLVLGKYQKHILLSWCNFNYAMTWYACQRWFRRPVLVVLYSNTYFNHLSISALLKCWCY